jgi:hypothetical protein
VLRAKVAHVLFVPELFDAPELEVHRIAGFRDHEWPISESELNGHKPNPSRFAHRLEMPIKLISSAIADGITQNGDHPEVGEIRADLMRAVGNVILDHLKMVQEGFLNKKRRLTFR